MSRTRICADRRTDKTDGQTDRYTDGQADRRTDIVITVYTVNFVQRGYKNEMIHMKMFIGA